MQKIVHGILFEGQRRGDAWDVSVWEQGGHREVSVRPVVEWHEVGEVPVLNWGCRPLGELDPVEDADLIEEKRAKALLKASQRAKTQCRRVIKAEGLDELLTITYRENQGDLALAKRHFKEWVRRMRRALGGEFKYCAASEVQDRGAIHFHVAAKKLPKHATHKGVKVEGWRLGTEVWRSIVGQDNGLVFVGGKPVKTRWGNKRKPRSIAKIADYVSKYIMKDYAGAPKGSNRYSRSDVLEVGKPQRIVLTGAALADVIGAVFELLPGHEVVSHRLGAFRDSYWLCTGPGAPPGSVN